jgi:hypothetical protein
MTTDVRRTLARDEPEARELEGGDTWVFGSHRSGVRPAVRVPNTESPADAVISVLSVAGSGALASVPFGDGEATLDDFRAALPELMGDGRAPSCLSPEGACGASGPELLELVLVSRNRVHVALRVPRDPKLALLSVSNRSESLGVIVSEARARLRGV